jgi:hypothetical protein
VSKEPDQVRQTLEALQQQLRDGADAVPAHESALSFAVPEDLARPGAETLVIGVDEATALKEARAAIEADERFEHLGSRVADPLRGRMQRFACLCLIDRERDHVREFMAEHERTPELRTCFLGVEFLEIDEEIEFFGTRLLPTDHSEVPEASHWFSTEAPVASVIAVEVSGTHLTLMRNRAVTEAERVLRVVRVAIRENRFLNPMQLRFRLSEGYSFGAQLAGWQTSDDARWAVKLDQELIEIVRSRPVSVLARGPRNNLEHHATRALAWIEDSMIESDRVKSLLFLFFALEAMLGTRSERLKAHGLAYRRALLSFAVRENFADPNRAYLLYDQVRSAAVHGEEVPAVSEDVQQAFAWDVRLALGEYLQLAEQEGFETRRALLAYLREHPDRERLAAWLMETDDLAWGRFFGQREGPDA